jgi:nucleoside-diphosphate-sugar epimerase
VSSSSVYGQADGSWVDEDSPTQPEEEAGQIVLEAETVLRRRLPAAIILRFAGIYGPGRLLRQKTIEASEPIVGNPEKWLNLIHVDDGASAILAVQQRAASGSLFNVCDGVPVMRRDFFAELARLLRAPPPRFAPPEGPVPHERGQRRIGNGKIMAETGLVVRYPSYREGLRAAVVSDAS